MLGKWKSGEEKVDEFPVAKNILELFKDGAGNFLSVSSSSLSYRLCNIRGRGGVAGKEGGWMTKPR